MTIFRPPRLSEFNFEIVAEQKQEAVSPSYSGPFVDQDANVLRDQSTTVDTAYEVAVAFQAGNPVTTQMTLVGNAGTLVGNRVSRVSDGTVELFVRHPYLRRKVELSLVRSVSIAEQFVSFANGSLAKHITDATAARASGKNSSHLQVYSTQDHAAGVYVRNTNCWLSSVNLTAISPWNSDSGVFKAGVAVSPRHIAFANHYQIADGATIRFITAGNQVVTRTMTSKQSLADAANDTCIGLLDSDLPGTIAFAKVLPSNALSYLPNVNKYKLAAVAFDYEENALAMELHALERTYTQNAAIALIIQPSTTYPTLTQSIISGDSGNPMGLIINGEFVLLTCFYGATSGAVYHKLHTEINAAMTSLGGGYQLTTIDLSGFNTYA